MHSSAREWLKVARALNLRSKVACYQRYIEEKEIGALDGKSETRRDAETLLKNSRLDCKKVKNPRLEEIHKNETSRLIINAVPRFRD